MIEIIHVHPVELIKGIDLKYVVLYIPKVGLWKIYTWYMNVHLPVVGPCKLQNWVPQQFHFLQPEPKLKSCLYMIIGIYNFGAQKS